MGSRMSKLVTEAAPSLRVIRKNVIFFNVKGRQVSVGAQES